MFVCKSWRVCESFTMHMHVFRCRHFGKLKQLLLFLFYSVKLWFIFLIETFIKKKLLKLLIQLDNNFKIRFLLEFCLGFVFSCAGTNETTIFTTFTGWLLCSIHLSWSPWWHRVPTNLFPSFGQNDETFPHQNDDDNAWLYDGPYGTNLRIHGAWHSNDDCKCGRSIHWRKIMVRIHGKRGVANATCNAWCFILSGGRSRDWNFQQCHYNHTAFD